MAKNKRIFYAVQQIGLLADSEAGGSYTPIHGAQTVGMTTNFNLQQVFELGQISIYQNVEQIPDVQATLSKVLDGYPLMYTLATKDALTPTLAGRSTAKALFALSVFPDTQTSSTGQASSTVQCSGMFPSSVGFNFPVDGNFVENMTIVGNDKVWANTPGHGDSLDPTLPVPHFEGAFSGDDAPIGAGGVNRRQHMIFDFDPGAGLDVNNMVADSDATILPPEVFGITNSGTNEKTSDEYGAHLQDITVSTDLGREAINELGRFGPYHRFVNFPVQVTCEIQAISISGDMISGTERGIYTTSDSQCERQGNLKNRTIRIATCEGTRVYLGTRNKLTSVNYSGGDATGGNVTVSYQFSTFNDMTVMHSGDPNVHFAWGDRDNYLVDLP